MEDLQCFLGGIEVFALIAVDCLEVQHYLLRLGVVGDLLQGISQQGQLHLRTVFPAAPADEADGDVRPPKLDGKVDVPAQAGKRYLPRLTAGADQRQLLQPHGLTG